MLSFWSSLAHRAWVSRLMLSIETVSSGVEPFLVCTSILCCLWFPYKGTVVIVNSLHPINSLLLHTNIPVQYLHQKPVCSADDFSLGNLIAFAFLSTYVETYKKECKFWDQFSKEKENCHMHAIGVRSQDSFNKPQESKKTTTFSFSSLEFRVDWTLYNKALWWSLRFSFSSPASEKKEVIGS